MQIIVVLIMICKVFVAHRNQEARGGGATKSLWTGLCSSQIFVTQRGNFSLTVILNREYFAHYDTQPMKLRKNNVLILKPEVNVW